MFKVQGSGIVYRNPSPHVVSRHAYFPSLIARPDGSLFCAMDVGSAFEAIDVRAAACASHDGGATWTMPRQIYVPDTSRHAVSTTTRLGQMADGSLVGWAALFDRTREGLGLVNAETDGFVPMTFGTVRSTDGGQNWSAFEPTGLPVAWGEFETCSPPVQVGPGRWLIPASPMKAFDGSIDASLPPGIAWTSRDAGRTLDGHVVTFDRDPTGLSALEQKLTRLSDGRWLVVCWSIDAAGRTAPNRYAISTDDVATAFGPWRSTGITGETCTPIGLPDGRVFCAYRNFEKGGLWGQLATINSAGDWTAVADACLWDGAVGSPERKAELRDMKDLRFGLPSVAKLKDGDLMVAFWCVEKCVSNIRWTRISVK